MKSRNSWRDELEHELIHALAAITGLTAAAASAARRTLYPVTGYELLVARQDAMLAATAAGIKDGFGYVFFWDTDRIPAIGISDTAFIYRIGNRFLDGSAVTPQEALPVNRALVAALRSSIDDQKGH